MKPNNVNMYQPVMIQRRPRKKNRLPLILDSLIKNPRAFLAPTRATTPIKNDIYTHAPCYLLISYISNGEHASVQQEEDTEAVDYESEDDQTDANFYTELSSSSLLLESS